MGSTVSKHRARGSKSAIRRLPRILIIYTGGTFGMDLKTRIPKLTPASLRKRLLSRVPEIMDLAHCEVEVAFNRDSAHIGAPEWLELAQRIQKRWKNYDGVVVLHGTDTLSFTASALSFLLRPCLKPVVLTGAQRPLAELRSDARQNLISAVEIAANGPRDLVNQVTVFFDDELFQGNRTHKRSAFEFSGFESPRALPLASVGTEIRYLKARSRISRVPLKAGFSERVLLLRVTPGFPAKPISDHLLSELDGLVLIAFPSGTAPTHDPEFLNLLRRARQRKVPVIIAIESVGMGAAHVAYEAGKKLFNEGCFWAGSVTPECAYVKTCYLLAQGGGIQTFARLWRKELASEGMR